MIQGHGPCGMYDGRSTGATAINEDPVGGHVSAFRRAARRQSDRGPRPGSDPDADEMNLMAADGALCWAAGMAAWTGREGGVMETDGLSDVGRLVVSAVQAGSAVEFRILKPGDGDGGHNR